MVPSSSLYMNGPWVKIDDRVMRFFSIKFAKLNQGFSVYVNELPVFKKFLTSSLSTNWVSSDSNSPNQIEGFQLVCMNCRPLKWF